MPIGFPVEGNDVVLLGTDGRELQSSGVGEIAVKSSYLSPGYWKRPKLTDEAFVDARDGRLTRVYRTGDLGYKADSGAFVHAGRTDFQVKVRGYRIEIGEIEAALLSLNSVRDGVVMARAEPSGDHWLVAYVVPAREPGPSVSELRRRLSLQLPEVMVPSRFVLLDALPQAPNGKVDRQNLPNPAQIRPELDVAFVAPRTSVEATLATILADLLSYETIGVHDDFYELGGDSLLAGRFIARVNDTFRMELSLVAVFETSTVAKLAATVTRCMGVNVERVRSNESIGTRS